MAHGNSHRNHAVKADVHRVRVGKRYWLFTFSDQWGPLLTDEWGEPVDNRLLADETHPFWDRFEAWLALSASEGVTSYPPPEQNDGTVCDHSRPNASSPAQETLDEG